MNTKNFTLNEYKKNIMQENIYILLGVFSAGVADAKTAKKSKYNIFILLCLFLNFEKLL